MSSQDTLASIQSLEEQARVTQTEIDKIQSDMADLQKDMNTKAEVQGSLQTKLQNFMGDIQNLREKYTNEQKQEQEELLKKQKENQESMMKGVARDSIQRGFFG